MKTIAERVRWLRKKRGLTQAEVDKIAGLSFGHTGAIERGRRKSPNVETLRKIAKSLGVGVVWLIEGGRF